MLRRLYSLPILLSATLLVLLTSSSMAHAQSQVSPGRTDPIKRPNNRAAATPEASSPKGWDGKVQGKALITPFVIILDSANAYDNFATGKLKINLILKNTLSGQTSTLDSRLLTENFRPAPDKTNVSVDVLIDNMSAPLSEAACGETSLSAEKTADGSGVNITLSYSRCENASAQMTADRVRHWTNVSGNLGWNLKIMLGDSRVVARDYASNAARSAGMVIVTSSNGKGSGSPKQAGF